MIEQELGSLAAQNERLVAAASEDTLCGHLRRAIHASRRSLAAIARDAGIDPDALSGFLEGTQGLPSESLDRLAHAAGVVVTMMQPEQTGATRTEREGCDGRGGWPGLDK